MNPIHEIAYLVLTGSLSCWTYPSSPCPAAESHKISLYESPKLEAKSTSEVTRKNFDSFVTSQVGYEENGFAVFATTDSSWHQIKNKEGKSYWLHSPSLQESFGKSSTDKQVKDSWKYQKVENILKKSLPRVSKSYASHLRKSDLTTPVTVSKSTRKRIHESQVTELVKEYKWKLPIAYVRIQTGCTVVQVSHDTQRGTCPPPPQVRSYADQDLSSEASTISMTSANWVGRSIDTGSRNTNVEYLYIFEKQKDWLKIEIAFGPKEKRQRWLRAEDLKSYGVTSIPHEEQLIELGHLLRSTGRSNQAKALVEFDPNPGFDLTGKTKWSPDGVLWVEVVINDVPACTSATPKSLQKAWLPYKLSEDAEPIVAWYARGC